MTRGLCCAQPRRVGVALRVSISPTSTRRAWWWSASRSAVAGLRAAARLTRSRQLEQRWRRGHHPADRHGADRRKFVAAPARAMLPTPRRCSSRAVPSGRSRRWAKAGPSPAASLHSATRPSHRQARRCWPHPVPAQSALGGFLRLRSYLPGHRGAHDSRRERGLPGRARPRRDDALSRPTCVADGRSPIGTTRLDGRRGHYRSPTDLNATSSALRRSPASSSPNGGRGVLHGGHALNIEIKPTRQARSHARSRALRPAHRRSVHEQGQRARHPVIRLAQRSPRRRLEDRRPCLPIESAFFGRGRRPGSPWRKLEPQMAARCRAARKAAAPWWSPFWQSRSRRLELAESRGRSTPSPTIPTARRWRGAAGSAGPWNLLLGGSRGYVLEELGAGPAVARPSDAALRAARSSR